MKTKFISLLSVVIIALVFFSRPITNFMKNVTKIHTVTIRSTGDQSYSNFWINKDQIRIIENEFYEETEEGHFISDINGAFLTVQIEEFQNPMISVVYSKNSSILKIENGFTTEEYNCYSSEDVSIDIALTAGNNISLFRIAILLLSYLLLFFILYMILYIIKKMKIASIQWITNSQYSNKILFAIIWLLFFLYCMSKLDHVENYVSNSSADTNWYWTVGNNLISNGSLSIQNYSLSTAYMSHRGYIVPFLFWGLQKIALLFRINPFIMSGLFLSLISAILLTYVLPGIAKITLKIKFIHLYQILLSIFLFFIFMRGHLLFPMSDLFAAFSTFVGIFFFLRFYSENKAKNILIASIFFTLAAMCKSNFKILLLLEVIIIMLHCKKNNWKNLLQYLIYCVLGIFVISIPQILINYYRGEFGLFPSATESYYMNQSLMENGISGAFQTTQVWPYFLNNSLGSLIQNGVYPGVSVLHIWDEFLIFISYPLETFCWILSKAFMAIDIRTPFIYTEPPYIYTGIKGISFLIINSAVWSSVLITLCNKKIRRLCYGTYNACLFGAIAIGLSLPLLIFSVEWRYFLPLHIWAYYAVSYMIPFCFFTETWKKRIRSFSIPFLLSILLFIVISITNYANYAWNNPGGFIF